MARNIFKCTKRKFGRLYCAFMKLEEDPETGQLEECGCILNRKDEYNLYPEHDSNGDVIRNNTLTSDPFPPGVSVIWENDSPHDTGLTFSFRRLRVEQYNMHPLYSIQEINEPFVSGAMGNDHVGYAFGESNVALSPSGWAEQKILGKQRVEDCRMGIYSRFDKMEKMVIPKCLRDYTGDIKGWINYTPIPNNPKRKTFFPCDERNAAISAFCQKKFGKTKTAAIIYQLLIAIKHGEYINLWEALINNGVPQAHVKEFMNEVSTKGKKTIYSNMNLEKYYLYWHALERMNLPSEKVYLFRCHLINYILNYPGLKQLNLDKDVHAVDGREFYPPNKRFWWAVMIVDDALRLAKNKKSRPILTNPKIAWFKKLKTELKKHRSIEPDTLNPAVETIYSIIGEKKDSPNWERKIRVFSRILLAGKRWSPPEVRISWFYFQDAYDRRNPERFWQYVETVKTSTPTALINIKHAAGIYDDDAEFTQQRAFAHHLLAARKARTSFVVEKPKLAERWETIMPKYGNNEMNDDKEQIEPYEIFWKELTKIWMKGENKYNYILQIIRNHFSELPLSQAKEIATMYQDEINENILIGRSVSKDDLGREGQIQIEDIDGNEEKGVGEWHDSESQE